jgi:hypothetical protein
MSVCANSLSDPQTRPIIGAIGGIARAALELLATASLTRSPPDRPKAELRRAEATLRRPCF